MRRGKGNEFKAIGGVCNGSQGTPCESGTGHEAPFCHPTLFVSPPEKGELGCWLNKVLALCANIEVTKLMKGNGVQGTHRPKTEWVVVDAVVGRKSINHTSAKDAEEKRAAKFSDLEAR